MGKGREDMGMEREAKGERKICAYGSWNSVYYSHQQQIVYPFWNNNPSLEVQPSHYHHTPEIVPRSSMFQTLKSSVLERIDRKSI